MEQNQQLLVGNFNVFPPLVTSLDLDERKSYPVKFRISDIRDIRKRAGSNSPVTWSIPSTNKNDIFFGGVYDIGADYTIFNPNKKVPCKHIIDEEEVLFGFLQLKEVTTNAKGDTIYHVAVYDQVASMYRNIGEKKVNEIDFSDLNHSLNYASLVASWAGNWDDVGYFYAFMWDEMIDGVRRIEKFKPAIYEKMILDRIIRQSHPDYPTKEFTWSGTFKDYERFERDVLPYSGDIPKISDELAASKSMFVGLDSVGGLIIMDMTDPPTSGGMFDYLTSLEIQFNDEVSEPYDDTYNLFDVGIFTAPVDGVYKFDCDLKLHTKVDYTITHNSEATSELKISAYGILEIRNLSGDLINPIMFDIYGYHKPYELISTPGDNVHTTLDEPGAYSVKLDYEIFAGTYFDWTVVEPVRIQGEFLGEEESGSIFMKAGWTARLKVKQKLQGHRFIGESDQNEDLELDRVRTYLQHGSNFRSQKIKSGFVANQEIEINQMIDPNLRQKDILEDIIARYNLHIFTNPIDENDIVLEFRDTFVETGPVVDWTKKRENKLKQKIVMIGELQNDEFLFTYQKASDPINEAYSKLVNGDIYGQYKFKFLNEFVKGVQTISSPFEATPFIRQVLELRNESGAVTNYSTAIVPAINAVAPKTKTRVLYAKKNLLTDDVSENQDGTQIVKWKLETKDSLTGLKTIIEITGYPYAGHLDHPINPTFDLNFGTQEVLMTTMQISWMPPNDNNFQTYWRNTMQQLARGQMLIDEFYLTPNEVANIRRNPNTKVFIENQYYYINQILFEGNQNLTKLAQAELITVEGKVKVPTNLVGYGGTSNDSGIEILRPPGTGSGTTMGTGMSPTNNGGKYIENVQVRGVNNNVGSYGKNITITGKNNVVSPGSKNVIIENSDGVVVEGSNVTVKNTSNIIVTKSNISIDGNTIIYEGNTDIIFNKIDGGRNSLRSKNSRFKINKIDGGKDEVLSTFNDSSVNKIETKIGQTKII